MASSPASGLRYAERLHVPVSWWVAGAVFVLAVWWAFYAAVRGPAAWVALVVAAIAVVAALLSYGRIRLQVDADGFHAGHAWLEWGHMGPATAVDPPALRRLLGTEADARAFLLTRPYCRRAVQVQVADLADPAPYWVVSSRRPEELAAHLNRASMQG